MIVEPAVSEAVHRPLQLLVSAVDDAARPFRRRRGDLPLRLADHQAETLQGQLEGHLVIGMLQPLGRPVGVGQ
jgi:hypothetical protein